jgi:hypothetical protein
VTKLPHEILPDHPAYGIKKHLEYVQQLHAAYPWRDLDTCVKKVVDLIDDDAPECIAENASDFLSMLFQDNDIFILEQPTLLYAPYLARIQKRLTLDADPAFRSAHRFLRDLYRLVPKGEGAFSTRLFEVVDPNDLIALCWDLYSLKHQDELLFPRLRSTLFNNMVRVSGHHPETFDGKGKLIGPSDCKLPAEEKIVAYLRDTPSLALVATTVPFSIPRKTFASHGIILAPPNHGKTQLLGTLIANFLRDENPVGIVLLDPHGDLFNTCLSVGKADPSIAARLVVLDPDTAPPALNFLDFGTSTQAETLQTFSYLMSSLSGGLTDKQGAIVPYLLKLLRQIPDASLETLRLAVDEKVKKVEQSQFAAYISALPLVDQGFFHNQFYSTDMQVTKNAIGWRLYSALASDAFREMFSAPNNTFSADDAMRDRKVVLVKGSRTALGDEGMKVFLQFIVAQFFSAALRRDRIPQDQRHLCVMLVDEAHHVFNSQTANILTECRKYGLGWLGASQVVQQIPDEVKAAIYGATAIKIAGPVSDKDAEALSREMYTDKHFIRSMKAREREGADFAVHVAGLTPHALKLSIPYGTLEAMPLLNDGRDVVHKPSVPPVATNHSQHKEEPRDAPRPQAAPRVTSTSPIEYDTDI